MRSSRQAAERSTNAATDQLTPFDQTIELENFRFERRSDLRAEKIRVAELLLASDGSAYPSLSDIAYAVLMEKYLKGFRAELGQGFQVVLGQNKQGHNFTADFLHRETIIENHVGRAWRKGSRFGDFESAESYFAFRREIKAAETREEKAAIREANQLALRETYRAQRRSIMDNSSEFRNLDLIVIGSPDEFYDKVLLRFQSRVTPLKETFLAEYEELRDAAYRASRKLAENSSPNRSARGRR